MRSTAATALGVITVICTTAVPSFPQYALTEAMVQTTRRFERQVALRIAPPASNLVLGEDRLEDPEYERLAASLRALLEDSVKPVAQLPPDDPLLDAKKGVCALVTGENIERTSDGEGWWIATGEKEIVRGVPRVSSGVLVAKIRGTGFHIGNDIIVTARHVQSCPHDSLYFVFGLEGFVEDTNAEGDTVLRVTNAQVRQPRCLLGYGATDERGDWAAFWSATLDESYVGPVTRAAPQVGDVAAFGFPHGLPMTVSTGSIASLPADTTMAFFDAQLYAADKSSGGPVLRPAQGGDVIGIVSSTGRGEKVTAASIEPAAKYLELPLLLEASEENTSTLVFRAPDGSIDFLEPGERFEWPLDPTWKLSYMSRSGTDGLAEWKDLQVVGRRRLILREDPPGSGTFVPPSYTTNRIDRIDEVND